MNLEQNQAISNDLKEFLDFSHYAAIYINQQAEVLYMNNKASDFIKTKNFDWDIYADSFNYINFLEKNSAPQTDLFIRNLKMILAGKKDSFKYEYCRDENIYFEVEISKFKAGALILYEDISDRKITEQKLFQEKMWSDALFKNSNSSIALLDENHLVLNINQKFEETFSYKLKDIKGENLDQILKNENEGSINTELTARVLTGETVETEGVRFDKYGKPISFLIKGVPIIIDSEVRGIYAVYEDISERKTADKKIKYIGYHDKLTGSYNRSYIEKELKKYDQLDFLPLAVVMIDINGLTLVNESYGYHQGDQILIEVADKLKSFLKDKDIMGRWSGDEFIILMPDSSKPQIEELRKSVDLFCDSTAKNEIPVSLGFGFAIKKEESTNIYQVINQADRKMNQDKLTKSRSSKNKFVKNLINTLGTKSNETKEHALRMTTLAFNLGDRLNLSHEKLNELNLLATLHDIGKVTISEKILNKPGKLSEEEWEIIKTHPAKGEAIAESTEEFASIAVYIRHHHESWDGSGYPDGLAGKEIPLLSRIITIVDSYDVMTNERPYKKAMAKSEAIKEIRECTGSQFEPELAAEFIKLLEAEEK